MGLTTAIGVLEGTRSPMFAIALVFSLIVRRWQHGEQLQRCPGAAAGAPLLPRHAGSRAARADGAAAPPAPRRR